ncbi:unnamed protein product [Rotaria magnacalcarata]|uniref:Aquaporin n=2 Tax=Rotaria magnacalcarata TaxID=392030 RepID=A0A816N0U2_9BILA|nr:unnamed protein product [Rotaria magnacalcarata]CAF2269109.1 unnamed protein product [Rotaria magnacalcarata]CAF4052126.1 unnamed protein product [Rotaria magnacalcarata]CAF4053621.1 unnamed protein product [Rotaria magnacalcarata]
MVKVKEFQQYSAQCLAEFFSTFMLILIGEASIAQYKFSPPEHRSIIAVNLSFGIGVYTALMIAGPISGAHLNPAVSISLLTLRKLKPMQCLFYIIGQILGAFFGALFVYFLYWGLFNRFDDSVRHIAGPQGTADIFFTIPEDGVHGWNLFFDQVVGTAVLMIFIMALGNDFNHMISEVAKPFAFVLIIFVITSAFARNSGGAVNPARDLGPRLFAAFIYGWKEVFQANNYFFWIPIVGPIVGAIIGVWLYESYSLILKRFSNLPNVVNIGSIELHPQVKLVDDDNQLMITHKLATIHS